MAKAILKLDTIKKDYQVAESTVHALKGVSLSFRKNEFVSVLGPSGCGKTTLLNIIGGLDHYTSGDLIIKGVSTKNYKDGDWDAYRNHSIGFVFQSYNLIPHQTVLGNVELALTLAGISSQERKERATRALERVGLKDHLNKKPNQLSGGQMQRVAIARALVNDPEILLADEPTGALDTETSIQIMELIKEIAGERLVIMVTHNPELARQYSTRIVRLLDGEVVDDTNPFSGQDGPDEPEEAGPARVVAAGEEEPSGDAPETEKRGRKKRKKTSMSFWTAFNLSGRNLLTKKARTIITSIAGSIGIISVCLVLALSSGFSAYINKTEEDMLSYYPIQVSETSLDFSGVLSGMTSADDMPDLSKLHDKVYINSFVTQLAQGMTVTNDINKEDENGVSYVEYVQNIDPELVNAIRFSYGVSLSDNLFTDVQTGQQAEGNVKTEYRSLSAIKEYFVRVLTEKAPTYGNLVPFVEYLGDVVSVMPGTAQTNLDDGSYMKFVTDQYDVVYGDYPSSSETADGTAASEQAVIVIGGNNDVLDLTLAQLGYLDEDEFLSLFNLGENEEGEQNYMTIDFSEIVGKTFKLYGNDEVYSQNTDPSTALKYPFVYNGTMEGGFAEGGREIEIVGILRLKDGLSYGCLSSGLNLTEKLVSEYIAQNMQSAIVQYLQNMEGYEIEYEGTTVTIYPSPAEHLNETYFTSSAAGYNFTNDKETVVRALGGNDTPNEIHIYPKDFNTKDDVLAYLDAWNDTHEEDSQVKYTDTVGMLMSIMQTMLDAITYVLIAFTGISLVVSTVMIGVITYVSVVERTKEIGVLRAIGARKKDIKRVFNAETFIVGFIAGLIGIVVAYLLQIVINLILTPLTGIAGLAALKWYHALIMLCISVVLTLISGLIPASAAAKKDPVIALRTE